MQTIEEWQEELKDSDKTIIVEGPNDKKALEYFGVQNIVNLSRKPLFAIIEEVAEQAHEVIILTDFDKKGREYYNRNSRGFERMGVGVDKLFREFLYTKKLSHIEGLVTFVRNSDRKN